MTKLCSSVAEPGVFQRNKALAWHLQGQHMESLAWLFSCAETLLGPYDTEKQISFSNRFVPLLRRHLSEREIADWLRTNAVTDLVGCRPLIEVKESSCNRWTTTRHERFLEEFDDWSVCANAAHSRPFPVAQAAIRLLYGVRCTLVHGGKGRFPPRSAQYARDVDVCRRAFLALDALMDKVFGYPSKTLLVPCSADATGAACEGALQSSEAAAYLVPGAHAASAPVRPIAAHTTRNHAPSPEPYWLWWTSREGVRALGVSAVAHERNA